MGLNVSIYRSDYDANVNRFQGAKRVCVVNVSGPFEPTEDIPAAVLTDGPCVGGRSEKVLVPAVKDEQGEWVEMPKNTEDYQGPSFGGTYASSSDSRWARASGTYGAIAVHDRVTTWETYNALTRD